MKCDLDRNLFTQFDLDSGALTLLGSVVHSFPEPGEYRGSVHRPDGGQAVFYLTVDKESSAASVTIDLAMLPGYTAPRMMGTPTIPLPPPMQGTPTIPLPPPLGAQASTSASAAEAECSCQCTDEQKGNRFTVNPKGYVAFHVSRGSGGYSVTVRRAVDDRQGNMSTNEARRGQDQGSQARGTPVFNSQQLNEGDFFAATILRPGTYWVANDITKAGGEIVVAYPQMGKTPYRPPEAVHVAVARDRLDPRRVELKPGQGVIFDIKQGPARMKVGLSKPDDGPGGDRGTEPHGWSKRPPVIDKPRGKMRRPREVNLPPDEGPAPKGE